VLDYIFSNFYTDITIYQRNVDVCHENYRKFTIHVKDLCAKNGRDVPQYGRTLDIGVISLLQPLRTLTLRFTIFS